MPAGTTITYCDLSVSEDAIALARPTPPLTTVMLDPPLDVEIVRLGVVGDDRIR